MPKLTMYFSRAEFGLIVVPRSGLELESFFRRVKPQLKEIVAAACSTKGDELLPAHADIDFVELHPSSDGGPASFELETYGRPARKKKFGTPTEPSAAVLALRNALVTALKSYWSHGMNTNVHQGFAHLEDPSNGILWVKWVDPDGPHV